MNINATLKNDAFAITVIAQDDKENAFPYRSLQRKKKPFDESRVFRFVPSVDTKPTGTATINSRA